MGNITQSGPVTFTAGEALEANRIVVLNASNEAVYADQYERGFGYTAGAAASGAAVAVVPFALGETFPVIASGAYAVGTMVYGADDGKVTSTSGGFCYGPVVDASVAADLECSVSYGGNGALGYLPLITKTASFTLTSHMSGATCTNLGASGAIAFSLPAAPIANTLFHFYVQAAQELRIDPGASDKILYLAALAPADGEYVTANAAGEWVTLKANSAGDWLAQGYGGTWTEETP